MEGIPLSGNHFVYLKLFLLVEANPFNGTSSLYWNPFRLFGVILFSGSHFFSGSRAIWWKPFILVEVIPLSGNRCFRWNFFFSIGVFFHYHSRITGLQGKGEGISLTPHYHLHPLHRNLDICRAINADSSPLHIGSSWTRSGNLWFPSAIR